MKPDTRTVNQLFELDVRYVVPLYQRPYVWNEEDQWEPLWEDINVLIEHQLVPHTAPDSVWTHFLGAIVLDQETQAPGSIPLYTVIDGQQRLTTLQLLLAAAARVASEIGADVDAQILQSLINNNSLKASGEHLFKVWPTNANRRAFSTVVSQDGPPPGHEDDPNNRIDEAYSYFVARIVDWIHESQGSFDKVDLIRVLRVTLCDLLKVVSITLEPGDNAQVIFETLNARGTPLLALDLVKNATFHEAAKQGSDVDRLYNEVWKPQLDEEYWRTERRQGRLFRPQADLFLMHWLTMKLGRVIPATELFAIFRKDVLQAPGHPSAAEVIGELCNDAAIMRSFETQPAGSPEALFFERLGYMDTSTVLPLILVLFREKRLSSERRRRALRILESWLARRSMMRMTVKNYNAQIPRLISDISSDISLADELLLESLRGGEGDISRWPGDAELKAFFESSWAYGNVARPRLVMALAAVERSLYGPMTDIPGIPSSLSLEHVIPRKWELHWPIEASNPNEEIEAQKRRSDAVHKLGNLTLTALPLNVKLSNGPWRDKQKALNQHSKLLLNTRLLERYGERFDEDAVDERTRELVETLCAVWPGPEHDWLSG